MTIVLASAWIPYVAPIKDTGIAGQFKFLTRRGPWVILAAVFTGNAGVFCWWSYVSPWLQKTGGWSSSLVPMLMMLAGFGMVIGGLLGGRLTDHWRHAGAAAIGQSISCLGLLLVLITPGNQPMTAVLTFWIAIGLFFTSAPQQLLMTEAGQGGGELIAGAAVQVAFNFGNAIGSIVGGAMLTTFSMNYRYTGLGGMPLALLAVGLLAFYSWRCETDTDAIHRLRETKVD